jgi:DNA mismatch repair ATPase MutS
MSFHIDRQTREELNLSGKFRTDSVYHLFNKVKSQGGAQMLDEMFRSPLEDAEAINARSSIIRYFQEQALTFAFDPQQLADVREYIDSGTGNSELLALGNLLVKMALSSLVHDEGLKKIVQGLHAAIGTLRSCREFIGRMGNIPAAYEARIAEVREIMADKTIVQLCEIDIYRALPLQKMASYDYFLRSKFRNNIEKVLSFIYEADVFVAVSDVARARGFAYAEAKPASTNLFSATDLRHPAIEGAVGNTVKMDNSKNIFFLTGANMAGKSTLMKAIGIGLYLAHMGFPVAASELTFSVRQGLYTSINTADNIGLGYSHFYAEVMRVKEAADAVASGKNLLLIFDELFKGTNVKDAYDGTLAVTAAFAEYRNCLFIVSTHIIEVGAALMENKHINFEYMPTVMENGRPRYTYQLKKGITEDRQGMMIIENEGILELITQGVRS